MENDGFILEVEGKDLERWRTLIQKMKNVFLELGFEIEQIENEQFLVRQSNYCKITPLHFPQGNVKFVIEWANSIDEVQKNMLEDGDLYSADIPEDELICMLREDLQRELNLF